MLWNRKGCINATKVPGYTVAQKTIGTTTVDMALKCGEHFPGCKTCGYDQQGVLKCLTCVAPSMLDANGKCAGNCPQNSMKGITGYCGPERKPRCGADDCVDCCPQAKCEFDIWNSNSTCSSCDSATKVMIDQNGVQKCLDPQICSAIQGAEIITDSADAKNKNCNCKTVNGSSHSMVFNKTDSTYSCMPCNTVEEEEMGMVCNQCRFRDMGYNLEKLCVDCDGKSSVYGYCVPNCMAGQTLVEVDHDKDANTPKVKVCQDVTTKICSCQKVKMVNNVAKCEYCFGKAIPSSDGSECEEIDMKLSNGKKLVYPNGTWTDNCTSSYAANPHGVCEPCDDGCGDCAYIDIPYTRASNTTNGTTNSSMPSNSTTAPTNSTGPAPSNMTAPTNMTNPPNATQVYTYKEKTCQRCMSKSAGDAADYFYMKNPDPKNSSEYINCMASCPAGFYVKGQRCFPCPPACTACALVTSPTDEFINCTSCGTYGTIKFTLTLVPDEESTTSRNQLVCNTTASAKELCELDGSSFYDETNDDCKQCGIGCDYCDSSATPPTCVCASSISVVTMSGGTKKVEGCVRGNATSNMVRCPKGFFFNDTSGECVSNTISKCDMQVGTGAKDCGQCEKGYVIKTSLTYAQYMNGSMLKGDCVDETTSNYCGTGKFHDRNQRACLPCDESNCTECEDYAFQCTTCKDANSVPDEYGFCKKDCSSVGANVMVGPNGTCDMCKHGFEMNNGTNGIECRKVCKMSQFQELKNNKWECTDCSADCLYGCEGGANMCFGCAYKLGKVEKSYNPFDPNATTTGVASAVNTTTCDYADCTSNCDFCSYNSSSSATSCYGCTQTFRPTANGGCESASGSSAGVPNCTASQTLISSSTGLECIDCPPGCLDCFMSKDPTANGTICRMCNSTGPLPYKEFGMCVDKCAAPSKPNHDGKCQLPPPHADQWGFVTEDPTDANTHNKIWVWNCTDTPV